MSKCSLLAPVSIDMDNIWCYQRSFGDNRWERYDSFYSVVVPRVLSFLKKRQLKITFFIVGKDAERPENMEWIKTIADEGHEIANHSWSHKESLHLLSAQERVEEIMRTHEILSNISSQAPVGFRGPAFGASPEILALLNRIGYRYDSSSFNSRLSKLAGWYHRVKHLQKPTADALSQYTRKQVLTDKGFPTKVIFKQSELWEVPVSTYPGLNTPVHLTYLNFIAQVSRSISVAYFRLACAASVKRERPFGLLLHATDFLGVDDDAGLGYLPGMKRTVRQKADLMERVFDTLSANYGPMGIADFLTDYQGHSDVVSFSDAIALNGGVR